MFSKLFKNQNNIYLIAGLGNPEIKYDLTRHNVGFMAIDYICNMLNISLEKQKFRGGFAEYKAGEFKFIFLKPYTYMNNSGECIASFVNFYKIPIQNILIICDDIHLPVGKIRVRKKGSDGGHNGLKNIEMHLNSDEYPRLRIGVGEVPDSKSQIDYVLGKFNKEDLEIINSSLNNISNIITEFASKDLDYLMNKLN